MNPRGRAAERPGLADGDVTTSLNAYDLTALRFGVAALILAPVALRRGAGTGRAGLVSLVAMVAAFGAPYVLLISQAMHMAPASAAGALNPGGMAIVSVLLGDHLGLSIDAVEALVVSHGHADHFGGLMTLIEQRRGGMAPDLPLYIGGDDALCQRWAGHPDEGGGRFGVLDRTGLEAADVRVVEAESGAVVAGHGFTSGVIERDSIEDVLPNTLVEIGEVDGNGCTGAQHQGHFSAEELAGNFLFDHHWGEHVTAYHVRDRGLVVITSCGHAGLINSVCQAQRASGIDQVHAVMGGFHLSPADPGYVEEVIDGLVAEVDPDYLVPMHCTGATFSHIMARKYPEKLITSYVGTRCVFGA